ncbi:DUF2059 domain-containing protein [Agrobacterium sp. ES01]|uniref:DUF2059 domain-containing protein n=1 Tax=Agrobacterium sp. ES01 TaxID=3420714 RepID=UPI003D14D55E
MIGFSRIGRVASVAIVLGSVVLGATAHAQDVSDEQLKEARSAISALGLTDRFDTILPGLAERLKAQLIQAYPNYLDEISATVDKKAIALASRRADLEKEAALVYAKAFTTEELKSIADFYSSDVGKKLLKDGPIAQRELLKAADIWASGIARDLNKETTEELVKNLGAPVNADGAAAPAAPATNN